jgi:hypothetical protein
MLSTSVVLKIRCKGLRCKDTSSRFHVPDVRRMPQQGPDPEHLYRQFALAFQNAPPCSDQPKSNGNGQLASLLQFYLKPHLPAVSCVVCRLMGSIAIAGDMKPHPGPCCVGTYKKRQNQDGPSRDYRDCLVRRLFPGAFAFWSTPAGGNARHATPQQVVNKGSSKTPPNLLGTNPC